METTVSRIDEVIGDVVYVYVVYLLLVLSIKFV